MKVIILEGPDNTGKNSLIHSIIDNNNVVKYIHCGKPSSNEPFKENERLFFKYADDIIRDNQLNNCAAVVFNRYYPGEYVYGQLYRNGDIDIIKDMISGIESLLVSKIGWENIFYIQLNSTSADLLKHNEDGHSLSMGVLSQIAREIGLFEEVFQFSKLKKHQIYVNEGDAFRSQESILNEFHQFIQS